MQYQKLTIVEAREYDGPKLTVVNDAQGEQIANKGDYLLGSERGKISVMSKGAFEEQYSPYTPTAEADALKASQATLDLTQKTLDGVIAERDELKSLADSLATGNAALKGAQEDALSFKAQVDSLTAELATEKATNADLQGTLDHLTALAKTQADAQATIEAAQTEVADTLK